MESNNSYQKIKNFISQKIQNVEGVLPNNIIETEINNTRELISKVGIETFAQFLSMNICDISLLSESDWDLMKRELETHFNVQMENGILIQGMDQQLRDTTWWTGRDKQKKETYYWNRYKEYMKKSFPPEVVKTIDTDTDIVMDNIEDPMVEEFSRYGMVVGHVQSGKTANYSALICKAADAGYKFIVVIAGGINNLRDQTQVRINESFIGWDKGIPIGVGKLGNMKKELLPISLTTAEQDFNRQDANKNAQGLNFDNISSPILLVIKKNSNTLANVIKWLEAQYKYKIANHAMLLIDDESDYASINYKDEEEPTIINKRIRKLLHLFNKSIYVAYTATPYANIFIDHEAGNEDVGVDLFPKDFIYALDAPDNYFGARKIFLDTNKKHIIEIDDYLDDIPEKHKKDYELLSIPDSLYDAIRVFVINVGVRYLRKQENKHNSMLIHATRFTMVHKKISIHVENYITKIKKDINTYGSLEDALKYSCHIKDIKDSYDARFSAIEHNWQDILQGICNTIDTIIIREVHQKTSVRLEYRNDRVTNAIVIGGTSLSRGYTLEGLSISYFLRNTVFYDTLMQMGRWFGYREGYEDLCRIYMSESMSENFALIIRATEDLVDNFKRMSEANMTPNDFGLSVQYHPDSGLQVTARNKQKNSKDIYFEMKLDGHLKETSWILNDESSKKNNLQAIKDITNKLSGYKSRDNKSKNHLWEDVNKEVVLEFIEKFKVVYTDQFGLRSRMPIDFIKQYIIEVNILWDVALYGGTSNETYVIGNIKIKGQKRKIINKGNYYEVLNRQVSSGSAEAIVLPEELRDLSGKRKSIRENMKKPLLMLHILDSENLITGEEHKGLAAFGISFPGGISNTDKTVKLKINSVYIQELLNEEEYDD